MKNIIVAVKPMQFIDPNSAANSNSNIGCVCNDRYWGVGPLNTISSCTSCYLNEILVHKLMNTQLVYITITSCLAFNDLLSFGTLSKCTICPDGMYLEDYVCRNCTSECSTCKDLKFHLTCTDFCRVVN